MRQNPISTEDMRILELNADYLGVTLGMLMQSAGREVAAVVEAKEHVKSKHVVLVCGTGGNGGDGMVAARYLYGNGANVEVFLVGTEESISSPDTLVNWRILKNIRGINVSSLRSESDVKSCRAIGRADVLIDAMLGVGLRSPLREPMATAVKVFNNSKARKYSIDVPTGIDSDSGDIRGDAVKADVTITLHAPKPGLLIAAEYVGDLRVADIGILKDADSVCGAGDLWLYTQPRKPTAHKGDFGRILVIGGSDVFSGAPALTAMAALRTGADLVSVLAPEPVFQVIRSYSPNLMVRSLGTRVLVSECIGLVREAAQNCDVVAIGPGLGQNKETLSAASSIVDMLVSDRKLLVVDADGLKALGTSDLKLDAERCVVTPHWGELKILMGKELGDSENSDNRIQRAVQASAKFNAVVLLKGAVDVITHPSGRHKLNYTGVPAMTVGGTGDVLTGIVATMLSHGYGAFKAACAAAFVSGLAGECAFRELGNHIAATDCIAKIPEAMRP